MPRTTRTRRTADQWRKLIAEQADSGLSQEAYCKHKRLALRYMKVLYFDRGGYCLWCKRLEQGQFNYKAQRGDKQALSWTELKLLLDGVEVQRSRQFKRYQHPSSTAPRYNAAHG